MTADVRLLGPAEIRGLAADLGLRPTKQRGQNFVIDPNTVRRIAKTAELDRDEVVVEIGPGLGSLTLALLEQASRVIAVEVDPILAGRLAATIDQFAAGRVADVAVVQADALALTSFPADAGEPTALVANLPYNISVPVLLHFLEQFPSIRHGLVMVQSEVADRLAAGPGSRTYGVPSVKAAWWAEVTRVGNVGRAVFWPTPNVDSGLVRFVRRAAPRTTAARADVFEVIEAAFGQRRKGLRQALATVAGSPARAEVALLAAGIDPRTRGEALTVTQFARLAESLAAAPAAGAPVSTVPIQEAVS